MPASSWVGQHFQLAFIRFRVGADDRAVCRPVRLEQDFLQLIDLLGLPGIGKPHRFRVYFAVAEHIQRQLNGAAVAVRVCDGEMRGDDLYVGPSDVVFPQAGSQVAAILGLRDVIGLAVVGKLW